MVRAELSGCATTCHLTDPRQSNPPANSMRRHYLPPVAAGNGTACRSFSFYEIFALSDAQMEETTA